MRTRSLLIEAAASVFASRGFYGASVEEIAEQAGFSKGAFYSNFQTKDDLFLALLDDRIAADLAELARLEEDGTPQAFLDFIGSRSSRRNADWALLSAELWLHALRNPALIPKLAARQRAGRAALARVISGVSAQMGLSLAAPAEDLASVMLAVEDGLVLQESLDPTAVPGDLRLRALGWFVGSVSRGDGRA